MNYMSTKANSKPISIPHYPYHGDVYHQNLNVYLSPHKTNCFTFKVKLKRSFFKSEFYTNIKKAGISPSSE